MIDERADDKQREALFAVLSGKHSDEGTLFHIFSLIVSRVLDPVFAPITFDFDMDGRTARISVPGVLEIAVQCDIAASLDALVKAQTTQRD